MTFDAFISYARQSSSNEAAAIKSGLESYARPWNKARSTHVFVDDASLSAAASLEGTIERSLQNSKWLIVLLSEAAARSEWVDKEVEWWLEHKSFEHLLLVHVNGVVAWETDSGFASDSTAVPPSLRALTVEPRWVDMTWFGSTDAPGREDPRFEELVLQLYCPIHGLERGEAVARRDANVKRAKQLTRAAIATLSSLLVVAMVSAGFAVVQMHTAQRQTELATVRLLVSESERLVLSDVGLSRLLAAQAHSMASNDQTYRNLFESLMSGPHLVAEMAFDSPKAVTTNESGSIVAIVDQEGNLLRWDIEESETVDIGPACKERAGRLQMSNDGRVIVGNCLDEESGFAYLDGNSLDIGEIYQISVSPSGDSLLYHPMAQSHLLWATDIDRDIDPQMVEGSYFWFTLRNDQTFTTIDEVESVGTVYDVNSSDALGQYEIGDSSPEYQTFLSRTGEAFWDSMGLWTLPDDGTSAGGPLFIDPKGATHDYEWMAISDKGDTAAYVVEGGSLQVTTPAQSIENVKVRANLEASDDVKAIAIGGSDVVVAAHDGVISVWNLGESSEVVKTSRLPENRVSFESGSMGGTGLRMCPNDTGSMLALGDSYGFIIVDSNAESVFEIEDMSHGAIHFLGWQTDTEFLYFSEGYIRIYDAEGRREVRQWLVPADVEEVLVGGLEGETGLVLLADSQAIHRFAPEMGVNEEFNLNGKSVESFSRDGSLVILSQDADGEYDEVVYEIWDSKLEHQILASKGHSLEFVADNVVLTDDYESSQYELIDLTNGERSGLSSQSVKFDRLPVSADGNMIASTGTKGYVILMNRLSKQKLVQLPVHLFRGTEGYEWAHGAFSGNGKRFVMISDTSSDGYYSEPTLTVVELDPDWMMKEVCRTVGRSITDEEWTRVTGLDIPRVLPCQSDNHE